jgi:hypothetical protein
MKRNFRFGTVAAESYLCPASDTTNLPTKQAREEMTMFAPTGFAPRAGVEHQYLSAGSSRLGATANTKSYADTFLLGWQTADRSHNRQLEEKAGKAL